MYMKLKDGKSKVLTLSYDDGVVHNPTATDVWFVHNNQTYCVRGGQTLYL